MTKTFKKGLALLLAAALAFSTPLAGVVKAAEETGGDVTEYPFTALDLSEKNLTENSYYEAMDNPLQGEKLKEVTIEYTINLDASAAANGWDGIMSFYDGDTRNRVSIQTQPYVCYNAVATDGKFIDYKADALQLGAKGEDTAFKIVINADGITMYKDGEEVSSGITGESGPDDANAKTPATFTDIIEFIQSAPTLTIGVGTAQSAYWNTEVCTLKDIKISAVGTEPQKNSPKMLKGSKAVVSGGAIEVTYEVSTANEPDSVQVKVGDTVLPEENGKCVYTPETSGTYEFTITATKGEKVETEKCSVAVVVENGKLLLDEELITNLKASKGADAYSITYDKPVADAAYTVDVTGGGKTVPVDEDGNVKFTDLVSGTEYTVTVTAAKEGYVTKTATTTFKYEEEKVADAAADVKRTMINKTLGKTDYTTAFWSLFEPFQIEDNKKYTFVFENHGGATNNYENFVLAFANQADCNNDTRGSNYVEYAVVRADNYEWIMKDGATLANTSLSGKAVSFTNSVTDPANGSDESWAEWRNIIKDSDVTMNVIRSGSEVKIEATIVSQADNSKKIDWTVSLNAANADGSAPNPLYMAFTVDHCYLNLKYVDEQVSNVKLEESKESTEKPQVQNKSMMINKITAKLGAKKVTGTVNASNATVQVKVGKAAYKKATVSGKNFTLKTSKLKIGTKVTVKATAEGYTTATKSVTVKGTMKVSGVKAKKGSTKVSGKVSVKKATVKVKVGKKKYKKAKVSGKKFTFKCAALKKGTKVKIKVTKKNYTTVTKTVKVK